jgi:exosortase
VFLFRGITTSVTEPRPTTSRGGFQAFLAGIDRDRWLRGVVLSVLLVAFFLPVIWQMVRSWWNDGNYSYGFFIPLVSLFWIHLNWDRLKDVAVRPSWLGLPPLLVCAVVYLFVNAWPEPNPYLMGLALVGSVGSLVILLCGWRVFWAYFFPIAYLVMMIPLPKQFEENFLTLPLQRYASASGEAVIAAFGIPIVRDGNVLRIPAMDLLVEEACSGIRSLFSLSALSVAMVFLFDKRWWEKILLIALTPPIAVLANVIRVSSTGLLAEWVSKDIATGFLHYFHGLGVFLVGMVMLLVSAWIIRTLIPPRPEAGGEADPA